jgi:hypothetical protein
MWNPGPPVAICLFLAFAASGCTAPDPAPPSAEIRAGLGRIALVASPQPPALRVIAVPGGRLDGAANGAGAALVSSIHGCLEVDPTGICALAALVLTPYISLGGAIYGAVAAAPESEVAAAGREIESALTGEDLQTAMAGGLAKAVRAAGLDAGLFPPEVSPAGAAAPVPDHAALQARGFDTLLEVRVMEVRLGKRPAVNPPLHVVIEVQARLIRLRDGREVYRRDFAYRSEQGHRYAAWGADRARALRAGLGQGYRALSDRMVAALLLDPN